MGLALLIALGGAWAVFFGRDQTNHDQALTRGYFICGLLAIPLVYGVFRLAVWIDCGLNHA
jgi:hypothetical protein